MQIVAEFEKIKKKYAVLSVTVRASLWYTICNVMIKGLALLSTPIFTRLLTEEEYGTFTIFQSWFSILIVFSSLNVFLSGYTKGLLVFKNERKEFTSSTLFLTTVITLILFFVYLTNIDFWNDFFQLSTNFVVVLFLELLFMPALDLWAAEKRFDYKYKEYVFVTFVSSVISLVGGVIFVVLSTYKLEARVYTDAFSKIVFAVILYLLIIYKGKKIFSIKYWKYSLRFNLPLLPHYLSNYVLSQSDRLMIGKLIGTGEAAMYSVAYTISTMMNLITMAINNALTPFIYKSIDSRNEDKIKGATSNLFFIVAILSVVTMAFAPEIILVFAGKNYMEAIYVIPPISASVFLIFLYAMFSSIEYYYQKTGLIAIATTFSAILNLILNYVFIPIFGYYAAGYTTLISYIVLTLFHYAFYKKIIKENLNKKISLYNEKMIAISTIFVFAVMFLMIFLYDYYFVRYGLIVVILLIGIIKRNKIKELIVTIRE